MSVTLPPAIRKFIDPDVTADGKPRASVDLNSLKTLWVNTGTLCNLTCTNCYIESSPRNDRLTYISASEVARYFDEIESLTLDTAEIGFTGGEPFMNPEILDMIEDALSRGYDVIVLTNAMKPMLKFSNQLAQIGARYTKQLTIRVSLDHYTKDGHEKERGPGSWHPTLNGLKWLKDNGFNINVAGRLFTDESEETIRDRYNTLFSRLDLCINAYDVKELVLFPEMDASLDVPEITTECWDILGIDPASIMCASSRMVVKRRGATKPSVLACTLLPSDEYFELGTSLEKAALSVSLKHPHCAQFCVLGGAACS